MASKHAIQLLLLGRSATTRRLANVPRSISASISAGLIPQRRCAFTTTTQHAASNLPAELQEQIKKEALLPCADPGPDSATASLVNDLTKHMVATYSRPIPIFVKGEGCYLYDSENRKYLDFTSGIAVNALGHADPELCRIINDQARQLIHLSNLYHNPWTGALSRLLVQSTIETEGMAKASRAFICNSGSEANEAAIKFARKVGKVMQPDGSKIEFVSFHNSFHGRTMGSLSATPTEKYQKPFGPMVPGFRYGNLNDVEGLKELVTEKTCGVIVEPIQGEGGVNVASNKFLIALRRRCDEVGAVLIFDEIQCGLGRSGEGLWAHSNLPKEFHPDIVTTAKALGNGFPIGATIVTEDVASKIVIGDHGTTFGGNPLACRVAHYVLGRLSDPELIRGVNEKSGIFRRRLQKMAEKFPGLIKEVRGKGLILGVQLDRDPTELVKKCRENGLLVITAGTNTLRIIPPLVIGEEEINVGLDILEKAIEEEIAEKGNSSA